MSGPEGHKDKGRSFPGCGEGVMALPGKSALREDTSGTISIQEELIIPLGNLELKIEMSGKTMCAITQETGKGRNHEVTCVP